MALFNFRKIFLIFILGVFLSLFVTEGGFSFDMPKSDFTKGILPNGIAYIIKDIPKDTQLVSIRVLVKTGSAREGNFSGSGISHFTEHMMFKGTPTRPVGSIEKEVKSLGGYINASTSHDLTIYEITLPSEYTKNALAILGDMLFNSSVDQSEFDKEKNVILKEIRMRDDDPNSYLSRIYYENAYVNHPYKYPVIGYEDIFKNITRDDLLTYYKRKYTASNMVIGVAGRANSGSVKGFIEEIFGEAEGKPSESAVKYEDPPINGIRESIEYYETPLAHVNIGFEGVDINHKDSIALDVLAMILGQGASSRLNKRLVDEKRLAYQIGAWNYTPFDRGTFEIMFIGEPDKYVAAAKEIFSEIENIRLKPVSSDELKKAKKSVLSGYIYSKESSPGQAVDMVSNFALTGNADFSRYYIETVDKLTSNDIKDVAAKYLRTDNYVLVGLLPKNLKESEVPEKKSKEYGPIEKTVLSDGITLLLKSDTTFPIISMTAIFKGGVRVEDPAKNGLSELTSGMLFCGTKTKSRKMIAEILENNGIQSTSFSGVNGFGIRMKFLKSDKDIALGLFSDIVMNSTFPEGEFNKEKEKAIANVKMEEKDVFDFGIRNLKKTIFKVHPYGLSPSGEIDTLNKMTRDDCLNFYHTFVKPGNMVLAIFGDLNPETMKADIDNRLKNFTGPNIPVISVKQEPEQKELRKDSVKLDKKESVIFVGLKTTTIMDKDKYALDVLSAIMSGLDGRLFRKIRSEVGLSYVVGGNSVVGVDPGYFIFYVATTKANVAKAEKIILSEIDAVKKGEVTPEELKDSKASLIGADLRFRDMLFDFTFKSASDEIFGLGFDNYNSYASNIDKVSLDDIKKVAEKYFLNTRLNIVTVEGND